MHWLSKMIRNIHLRRGRQRQLHLALTLFLNVNLKPTNTVSMTRRHDMLDHIHDLSSSYDCWLIRAAFTTHQARHGHGFQRRTASEMPGSHALQRKQSWAQTDGIMFLLQPTHAKQMHMPSVDHEVSGSVLQFVSRRVLPFSECSRKWWEPLQKYLWMKYWSFKKCMSFTRPLASVRPAALLRNAKNSEIQWT